MPSRRRKQLAEDIPSDSANDAVQELTSSEVVDFRQNDAQSDGSQEEGEDVVEIENTSSASLGGNEKNEVQEPVKDKVDPSVVPTTGTFFLHDDRFCLRKGGKGGRKTRYVKGENESDLWLHDKFEDDSPQPRRRPNRKGGERGKGKHTSGRGARLGQLRVSKTEDNKGLHQPAPATSSDLTESVRDFLSAAVHTTFGTSEPDVLSPRPSSDPEPSTHWGYPQDHNSDMGYHYGDTYVGGDFSHGDSWREDHQNVAHQLVHPLHHDLPHHEGMLHDSSWYHQPPPSPGMSWASTPAAAPFTAHGAPNNLARSEPGLNVESAVFTPGVGLTMPYAVDSLATTKRYSQMRNSS